MQLGLSRWVFPVVLLLVFGLAMPAQAQDTDPGDVAFWQAIQSSKDPAEYNAYLQSFPNGRFAGLARLRLSQLGTPAVVQPVASQPVAPQVAAPAMPVPANPALPAAQPPGFAHATALKPANLRGSPSASAARVGGLSQGEQLFVRPAAEPGWYEIARADGSAAYVHGSLIGQGGQPLAGPLVTATVPAPGGPLVTVPPRPGDVVPVAVQRPQDMAMDKVQAGRIQDAAQPSLQGVPPQLADAVSVQIGKPVMTPVAPGNGGEVDPARLVGAFLSGLLGQEVNLGDPNAAATGAVRAVASVIVTATRNGQPVDSVTQAMQQDFASQSAAGGGMQGVLEAAVKQAAQAMAAKLRNRGAAEATAAAVPALAPAAGPVQPAVPPAAPAPAPAPAGGSPAMSPAMSLPPPPPVPGAN